ncbi:hypothetical protein QAD02_009041 [Eretmocerus hayati]|uniref:Uncharacterized protein n=1 Tax=Eretmocerus hayati TaxID=131215 RepID=A0ACC2N8J8_9HYME|nr:hypothetical protein QAD02_009041 [Eretmocerus hayati]
MENTRIQRLLRCEYSELLGDAVLVESPFAETTRDGQGLREVALALTNSKLIIAMDALNREWKFWCLPCVDPSIECLELVCIYPLEFVSLSVFRRKHRQALKARLVDGRVKYYELGGMDDRSKYWAIWCERVRELLQIKSLGSSLSETSAAVSSSCSGSSSLAPSSGFEYDPTSGRCRRSPAWTVIQTKRQCPATWTQRSLYLGPSHDELLMMRGKYEPLPIRFAGASVQQVMNELSGSSTKNSLSSRKSWPPYCGLRQRRFRQEQKNEYCNVIFTRKNSKRCVDERLLASAMKQTLVYQKQCRDLTDFSLEQRSPSMVLDIDCPESDSAGCTCTSSASSSSKESDLKRKAMLRANKSVRLFRFGLGIEEKCVTTLVLAPIRDQLPFVPLRDPETLIEAGVTVWEEYGKARGDACKAAPHRRYGLSPVTYFLRGLGPWCVQPGERDSAVGLLGRSRSCVSVRRQPAEPELRLPVSRRQLAASVSLPSRLDRTCTALAGLTHGQVLLFWTPDYWYRPQAATDAYEQTRRHLADLSNFRARSCVSRKRQLRSTVCRRREVLSESCAGSTQSDIGLKQSTSSTSRSHFKSVTKRTSKPSSKSHRSRIGNKFHYEEVCRKRTTVQHLRSLLHLDFKVTLWDVDSTTLAHQLTLVDRELFVRLPESELELVLQKRSSREAPNFAAWIAFAHRMSCLVASELLSAGKIDMRARLIARLVNTAEKLFDLGNFHSARSICAGLQSPAIYRLKKTWEYVKIHHATRYDTLEKLCRIFKNTNGNMYRQAWTTAQDNPPSMPFVGDVLTKILDIYEGKKTSNRNLKDRHSIKCPKSCLVSKQKYKPKLTGHGCLEKPSTPNTESTYEKSRGKVRPPPRNITHERDSQQQRPHPNKIEELTKWLFLCQRNARLYDFSGDSLAWEFLLKARYREDKDNFFMSLQLEPDIIKSSLR